MVKKLAFFLLPILFILFLCTPKVYADFNFTSDKTTIADTDELEVTTTISLQGQANKTYYLEGAFKKSDGSNYFGLTWNDSVWIKYTSSDFTSLKPITTDADGKWTGTVKVKIDSESPYYSNTGSYTFQLKRFTPAGSATWSDNSVNLNVITSSPAQTDSPTPTPIPTSSSSPSQGSSQKKFSVSLDKSTIDSNSSISLSIEITQLQPKTSYYLKGAFIKDNSSNYFGFTKVNGSWVKNSQGYSQQFPITSDDSGNWSGTVEVMPDAEDSGFTGSDDYQLKVGRYNASGSSLTWSDSQTVHIDAVATPDVTNDDPTETASPSATPVENSEDTTDTSFFAQAILSQTELPNFEATSSSQSSKLKTKNSPLVQSFSNQNHDPNWLLVGGGVMSLGVSSAAYLKMKKRKTFRSLLK